MELSTKKCRRHASREAAALCPECKNYFCRECVTEHDDKVICSDCLSRLNLAGHSSSSALSWVFHGFWGFLGLFIVWLLFYGLGKFLVALPSSFHEGTLWSKTNLKDPGK